MDKVIVAVMASFLVIGACDKAFFGDRYGYGKEFQKGLDTMGPLTLAMVGIMCAAPALGSFLAPLLTGFFLSIHSDPAMIPGLFLGVDAGGLMLAESLAQHPEAVSIFGIGLCSTLACILTFPLPFSLAIARRESRPFIAKGIVAGIIASPISMIGAGLASGCDLMLILRLGTPAFAAALALAAVLTFFRDATIRAFIVLGRLMIGAFALLLAAAAVEHWFQIKLIPGMAPISPQLAIVGEIGIMLAGAYPMVFFVRRHFRRALHGLAGLMRIDDDAALGMIVSAANPLPMYTMLDSMTNRGKVLCSAFSGPVLCMLGDHLGFMSAYCPEGISALIAGKSMAAVAALAIAAGLEMLSPSEEI